MKYIAQYEITIPLIKKLLNVISEEVRNDHYYSRHNPSCGMSLTPLMDNGLYRNRVTGGYIDSLDNFSLTAVELLKTKLDLGWTRCSGNRSSIRIEGSILTLTVEGRRHGVPTLYHFLKDYPAISVLSYQSDRTDREWWEKGIKRDEFWYTDIPEPC